MPEQEYRVTLSVPDQSIKVLAETKEDAEAQGFDWWYSNVVPCVEVDDA